MDSELDVDRGALREQPLSSNEKQLLSEYFQMEGRRQYENYQSLLAFQQGSQAGLFDLLNMPGLGILKELSEKQLTLELTQREHWINLIQSIHKQFFQNRPDRFKVMLWTLICLEKHAIVQIETGQDEYRSLLRESQQSQLQLIARLGEAYSKRYTRNIDLFYDLLNIDGLSTNLIGLY